MADEGGDASGPSPVALNTWLVLGLAFMVVLGLFSVRCTLRPDVSRAQASRTLPPEPEPVLLPPTPMDEEYFPCSECHEGEATNPERRELDVHDEWDLAHGDLWCISCHGNEAEDRLHLSDGTLVSFEESWRLCTQCHGQRLEEWRAGVHGKRTGHWWGPKEYWSCVACHNPHEPRFAPLAPKPPPVAPADIVWNPQASGEESSDEAE